MRNYGERSARQTIGALAVATVAVVATPAVGRPQSAAPEALAGGRVELSTGLSLNLSKQSTDSGSHTLLNVPLRVGFMVSRLFELEGEVLLTYMKDGSFSDTGVTGAAQVLYHFKTAGNTVPFLLGGGGYGNAVGIGNIAARADMNAWLLRAGVGVKCFVGRHAALRAEYRFTHYSGNESAFCEACPNPPSGTLNRSVDDNAVLVGISLWF
jgi:opacity protein-like surface antigen